MSQTERLFEAEAALRERARQFADEKHRPYSIDINDARRNLRAAAIEYAKVANEIDECFAEEATT